MEQKSGKTTRSVRLWIGQLVYYLLNPLGYLALFGGMSLMLSRLEDPVSLGTAMVATIGWLFLGTPLWVALLMRLSLLRWYVDPIAAAEIPCTLYAVMIVNQMRRGSPDFAAALSGVHRSLGIGGGTGWLFLAGLFVFGLGMSLSFARKEGRSLSYRILGRLSDRKKHRSEA